MLAAKSFDFGFELSLPGFLGFLFLLSEALLPMLCYGAQYLGGFFFLRRVDLCRVAAVELFVRAVHRAGNRSFARFDVYVSLDTLGFPGYFELPVRAV